MNLQRGTGTIPTIDANGAAISPELSERVRALIPAVAHGGVEVEMHPDIAAAWENCSVVVVEVKFNHFDNGTMPQMLRSAKPPCTFAGFPVRISLDYPRNAIKIVSTSRSRAADSELLSPLIAAQIVNLGLPHAIF